MSQDVRCRLPARRSKCAESKGTFRATIRTDTRHHSTVEPMMIAKDRKATLQAIHTKAVNEAVSSQRRNVVLDDRRPLINISEKELTRMERTTLAQLKIRTL